MIRRHFMVSAMALTLSVAAHAGQVATPAPSSDTKPVSTIGSDIIVQHRTDNAIKKLVAEMTTTTHGTQIARWNRAICPSIIGLDPSPTTYVENRIAANASSFKIDVMKKPCRSNIIIVFTDEADALTKAVIDKYPALFEDPVYGIRHKDTFDVLMKPRPVRWIAASRTGSADGRPIVSSLAYGGGSHIHQGTRENEVFALVIVDNQRLQAITWQQLSDYLTFVTLARPSFGSFDSDSILALFASRDAGAKGPPELTATDRSLLHGLYRSDPSLSVSMQRSQIADQVRKGQQ